jgi:fructose/tagatose bisphosphate aldolase
MSVALLKDLLAEALKGGYAIGYFEAWDQYSLEACLEAAEEMRSPAILGFGAAVTDQAWLDRCGVDRFPFPGSWR